MASSSSMGDAPATDCDPYAGARTGGAKYYRSDERAIVWDLRDTMTISLPGMIKLLTQLKGVREDNLPLDMEALQAHGNEQFDILLEESVAFCNDECTEGAERDSSELKRHIAEALKQRTEHKRALHFVIAFNSVLSYYRRRVIGKLGAPTDGDDFLFITHDPRFSIVPDPLPGTTSNTVRRWPDIQDVRVTDISWLLGDDTGNVTYDARVALIAKDADNCGFSGLRRKAALEDKRVLGWGHSSTCFEIDMAKVQDDTILEEEGYKYKLQAMQSLAQKRFEESESHTDSESRSGNLPRESGFEADSSGLDATSDAATGSKRKLVGGTIPTPKKARNEDERPVTPTCSEIWCGFHAVELMKSFPDRTHAIVFLLADSKLTVRYHDPQGCIASEPMDIITCLPYLVALLILFQRFGDRMRGRGRFDMSVELGGKEIAFEMPSDAKARGEWRGRRPVTGVPVPKGFADGARPQCPGRSGESETTPSRSETMPGPTSPRSTLAQAGEDVPGEQVAPSVHRSYETLAPDVKRSFKLLEDCYLKVSWREVGHDAEAHIVAVAKERALHYIGEHATSVTNHLPNIIGHGEFEIFSTGLPRELLRKAGFRVKADPGATRIPAWTLMERLVSMNELDPVDFMARFWEIIRCHSLLWRLGVAHGDVSFNNLMLSRDKTRAVLNDYDLAALMTPGKVSPTKKGFERTGTKPFMAMELLLRAWNHRTSPRLYRHDFESIVWCMVWYCKEQLDWLHGDYGEVYGEKDLWFARLSLAARADNKAHLYPVPDGIRAGTEELWHHIVLLYGAVQRRRVGVRLPGEQELSLREWVDIAEELLPRSGPPSREWKNFEVEKGRIRPIDFDKVPDNSS